MKTTIVAGLTALTIALSGGAAVQAQTTDTAVPGTASLSSYNWTFTGEYVDPVTQRSYYRAYAYDKQSGFMGRVIYKESQGEWHALPDRYLYTYWDRSAGRPDLLDSQDLSNIQQLAYDPSTDTVVRQVVFDTPGNESYGLLQTKMMVLPRKVNGSVGTTAGSLLMLKNYSNGEIREIGESEHGFFTLWLDDGKLLVARYSEEAKQNEIVKIDPATGQTTRLLLASIWGYNEAGKKLMIAYNEPTRRLWLYNIEDGTLHAASKQEIDSFYSSSSGSSSSAAASIPEEPADQPPSDLQPQQLPVTATTDTAVNEAEVTFNGTTVKLPFAFRSGGTTFLPVRPLADASVCKVVQTKTAGSSYYTLTGPTGSVKIRSEESVMLGYRLYVTTDQLKSIGLKPERLAWIHRG